MAFEKDFYELMPHRVEVAPWTGRNVNNEDQYGPLVPYQARVTGKVLSLRSVMGEESTVIFDLYLDAGNAVITERDRVVIPDDPAFVDRTPVIFAVSKNTDEDGHHHTKIQCGWIYHRQGQ